MNYPQEHLDHIKSVLDEDGLIVIIGRYSQPQYWDIIREYLPYPITFEVDVDAIHSRVHGGVLIRK